MVVSVATAVALGHRVCHGTDGQTQEQKSNNWAEHLGFDNCLRLCCKVKKTKPHCCQGSLFIGQGAGSGRTTRPKTSSTRWYSSVLLG